MIRLLSGSELAGYIKERQAHDCRSLRQAQGIVPRLTIIQTIDNPVIDTYVRLKLRYADDVGVEVEVFKMPQTDVARQIDEVNNDQLTHGIIVQLPLANPAETDKILNLVESDKDVDGLGANAKYDTATATAINWLMTGYNIDLVGRKITIVGNGRLVGAPLSRMWRDSGLDVTVLDSSTPDIKPILLRSDIIVSATGVPSLITSDMLQSGTVIVDAGTATDSGKIVGDVADEVYERDDITITPRIGGVGPLTIAALIDNVLHAARSSAKTG